jgi:hypothetical protein
MIGCKAVINKPLVAPHTPTTLQILIWSTYVNKKKGFGGGAWCAARRSTQPPGNYLSCPWHINKIDLIWSPWMGAVVTGYLSSSHSFQDIFGWPVWAAQAPGHYCWCRIMTVEHEHASEFQKKVARMTDYSWSWCNCRGQMMCRVALSIVSNHNHNAPIEFRILRSCFRVCFSDD